MIAVAERIPPTTNHTTTAIPVTRRSTNTTGVTTSNSANIPNAELVAVADAEITHSHITSSHHTKRRQLYGIILVVLVIVVAMAVGVGAYCGSTGNCGSTPSTTTPNTMAPVNAPIRTNTMSPISTVDSQWMTACTFLNYPHLSECQNVTSFSGKSVGTIIPMEIELLTQLVRLDLSNNFLIGSIPSSVGNLTQLIDLRF